MVKVAHRFGAKAGRLLLLLLLAGALIGDCLQEIPVYAVGNSGQASAYNADNPAYRYYYNQLNASAKVYYDAMYEMWQTGVFAKDEDFELTAKGYVTPQQLAEQFKNNEQMLSDFGAARDAFEYDFPDVFYVDWSFLSIRVTEDSGGSLHEYIGKGRGNTYLLNGFTPANVAAAVEIYENKINEILSSLPKQAENGLTLRETQTYYIHDWITHNMIYRFENQVESKGCNARTAFDALHYGEGVCEAYTRGFKALMDRAGIPAVCVYGVYKVSETQNEAHIWNYVQMEDGSWYGVDVTHDDPTNRRWTEKSSGHENRKYCLVGAAELASHHIPNGVMSGANYEFNYPVLAMEASREQELYADNDLVVKLVEDIWSEDGNSQVSGSVMVSYKGEDYTRNAEKGNYILARLTYLDSKTGEVSITEWSYICPELYDRALNLEPRIADPSMVPAVKEGDDYGEGYYVYLPFPHILAAQFAVTNIPPTFKAVNGGYEGSLYYEGNPNLFTVVSEEVVNKWSDGYIAPPYPRTASPRMGGQLYIGETYHIRIVYDQLLVPDGSGTAPAVNMTCYSFNADIGASTGLDYSKIENFKYTVDEAAYETVIEFDFTPSQQYADNYCYYTMNIVGLIGKASQKVPVPAVYGCAYRCAACAFKAQGFDWNVMGQPQLLDTPDLATDSWMGIDADTGEEEPIDITANITHRLTLVTTEPTAKKSREMLDLLEENTEDEILSGSTYNIQLTLCKKQIINTGQGVRVCVGFPKGYNYSSLDEGVTFKAYHYKADPLTGRLTGEVEEIECVVTELGLIITCDSFSPFTLAAVKTNENTVPAKNVVINTSENGFVYDNGKVLEGAAGILTLSENAVKNLVVKANEGYVIESVSVGNERLHIDEKNIREMNLELLYKNLSPSTIVKVNFMAESVHKQDIENGMTDDIPSEPENAAGSGSVDPVPPKASGATENKNSQDSQPQSSAQPGSSAQPQSSAQPESKAQPQSSAQPESKAQPQSSAQPESSAQPQSSAQSENEAGPESGSVQNNMQPEESLASNKNGNFGNVSPDRGTYLMEDSDDIKAKHVIDALLFVGAVAVLLAATVGAAALVRKYSKRKRK